MKLYLDGFFKFYLPQQDSWVEVEISSPKLLRQVLELLGIPPAEVHLAVVNDELADLNHAVVNNDDVVKLYPPVGGG